LQRSCPSADILDLWQSCRFSTGPFASIRDEYTAEEEKQGLKEKQGIKGKAEAKYCRKQLGEVI